MSQTTTSEPDGAVKASVDPRQFKSFAEFYPFYLGEHSNATCRRLHFIGTSLSLVFSAGAVFDGRLVVFARRPDLRLCLCLGRAFRL
jgi:hypothetical protein